MRDTRPETQDDAAGRDHALLARARAADGAAFEALLALHYRYIFRVAYRWLGHESDAEDVTQTVCMRLPEAIRSFDGRAAFTSWLYRVTLNAVRDLQRSRQRQARLVDAVAVLTEDSPRRSRRTRCMSPTSGGRCAPCRRSSATR